MAYLLGFFQSRVGILLLLLLPLSLVFSQIGGPYTVDANTVVLMHFDGNLNNESTLTAAGEFHGDASNFFFLTNQVPNLSQCLRIDNDSQIDSAFVTVADDDDLDMIGDWTIEGWINIFTFGTGSSDWRWVPRLAIKTGDVEFWQPNFFVEMWGDNRLFSCGYMTASMDQWPQANTPSNIMDVGTWYHMAFIRDTNSHLLMTIIHKFNTSNNQIELVSFTASDYLSFGAIDPTPIVTNRPLHIGYAGGGGDSFLDGFVDEIRISNVVREFPIPPIIADVSILSNQPTSVAQYEIGAHIFTVNAGSTIQSANLFYSADAGTNWTSVAMSTVSGDSMVGAIPQQPLGSVIRYYLEATDNNGLMFQFPQDAGWQAAAYYSFGVFQPNTLVMNLTFEEGSGVPVDQSDYHNPITPYGNPIYSTDAAAGNYSLYFNQVDSTMLESDSPFLAAKEYFLDFWAKPDTAMLNPANNYCRIINRPGAPNNHADNNYQVRFNPGGIPYGATDGSFAITLDSALAMDRWYHFQLEARSAPPGDTVAYYAIFRVEDTNGLHVQQKYVGFDVAVKERWAPLRIGKAHLWTVSYPWFYKGYFDNVMIYNYAAGNMTLENITSIDGKDATIPVEYALYQNYPNPFNPVTDIRFNIAKSGKVSLVIYDLLGRKVRTLINSNLSYGKHWVQWDGNADNGYPVASGVYFYRLEAKDFSQTMKMVLMK